MPLQTHGISAIVSDMKTINLLLPCLLIAGCGKSQPDTSLWQLTQTSDQGAYQAELSCTSPPGVGKFEGCSLHLESPQTLPNDLKIAVDGGMPSHGHGLPTAPQAVATATADVYRIEGLKYSMPGEWVLGFLLHTGAQQDRIIFKFTI
jgi:hypothetical protein